MKSLAATDKFAEILDWSLYQFNGSLKQSQNLKSVAVLAHLVP